MRQFSGFRLPGLFSNLTANLNNMIRRQTLIQTVKLISNLARLNSTQTDAVVQAALLLNQGTGGRDHAGALAPAQLEQEAPFAAGELEESYYDHVYQGPYADWAYTPYYLDQDQFIIDHDFIDEPWREGRRSSGIDGNEAAGDEAAGDEAAGDEAAGRFLLYPSFSFSGNSVTITAKNLGDLLQSYSSKKASQATWTTTTKTILIPGINLIKGWFA